MNCTTGDYKGLYSFIDDANGAEPAGWVVSETGDAVLEVVENITTHHKVVQMYSEFNEPCSMKNAFGQDIINGTVELWIRGLLNADNTEIELLHGTSQGIYLWFDWGSGKAESYTTEFVFLQNIVENQWYHVCIDFCSADIGATYDVYIDGVLKGDDVAYMSDRGHLDTFRLSNVGNVHTTGTSFIDAVDYNWTDGYYLNRNMETYAVGYLPTGSYVSPVLDLGCDSFYFHNVTTYCNIPSDSDLDLHASFSEDNVTWSGFMSIPLNWSAEMASTYRYAQLYFNFTASTDFLETSEVLGLAIFYTETMLNELPQLGDILVTFDNETLQATISCLITDPDNDTMDIFICLSLGDIIANQTTLANGTIVSFVYQCEYSSSYQFYLNVTDSEDSVQSSLFGWSTGAEPEEPPVTPTIYADLYDYATLGTVLLLSISFLAVLHLRKFK
jgi:hypothetical protein